MKTLKELLNEDFCVLYDALYNHNGSTFDAKKIINIADDNGANGVIFHRTDIELENIAYQLSLARNDQNSYGKTVKEHLENIELGDERIIELMEYAHKKELLFGIAIHNESVLSSLFPDKPDFVLIKNPESTDQDFIERIIDFDIPILLEHVEDELKLNIRKNLMNKVFFIISSNEFCGNIFDIDFYRHNKLEFNQCKFGLYNKFKNNSLNIMSLTKGSEIFIFPATRHIESKGDFHKFSNEKDHLKFMTKQIRWCSKIMGLKVQEGKEND